MIRLDAVSKTFQGDDGREVRAVADVTLHVAAGETVSLIGTSGSGKTTLLNLINRLLVPTRGVVSVFGANVATVDPVALRRRIGYVIQRGGLFPHLTVARNVGLLGRLEGWDRERERRRVDELLDLVHLDPAEFGHRLPGELSGGERQRVGVARALVLDPAVVLMDEPFGALDPITRRELQDEFVRLERQVEKTIVLVTHDVPEAFRLGDRVALMSEGRVVQVGTPEELRSMPADAFVRTFVAQHAGGRA